MRSARAAALLLLALPGALGAAEARVNTYTTGTQQAPRVAADANGAFVAVWTSDGQDGSGIGIYGARFNGAGFGSPAGGEFRANTYTTGVQEAPAVAMDGTGNFVVVWSSYQDGDQYGIYAQRYTTFGPAGAEFRVNATTSGVQTTPDVGRSPSGPFVVVWTSPEAGAGNGVFGQRYDGARAIGPEFHVNTYTTGSQYAPRVSVAPSGDFVVVWASAYGTDDVRGQRYSASGAKVGSEFVVSTGVSSVFPRPAVATSSTGEFVVAWVSNELDVSDVFARRYAFDGTPLTAPYRVSSYTTGAQFLPALTFSSGDELLVSWSGSSGLDGSGNGVFARRFESQGGPFGGEFRVNTYTTGGQDSPAAAAAGSGAFAVVWRSDGADASSGGIAGAVEPGTKFDPDDFRVNTYTTDEQKSAALAIDGTNGFLVVWSSADQDGSGLGIYGQRFAGTGVPRGGEFRVNATTINSQFGPQVATRPEGFFVVWFDAGQTGGDVIARRFDPFGSPLGGEFRVNTFTTLSQASATVAPCAGGFVVAWESYNQPGASTSDVFAQRYSAAGVPLGPEIRVNTYTSGQQKLPLVVGENTGGFVVVWASYGQDTGSPAVANLYAQRFASDGQPAGGEGRVNTDTAEHPTEPSVAEDGAGGFVVAWTRSSTEIRARSFAASGAPKGPEFGVSGVGSMILPQVGAGESGQFVIAWADSVASEVFARRFSRGGIPAGAAFRVSTYTTGVVRPSAVDMDGLGRPVVIFENGEDGSSNGIFRRRLPPLLSGDVDGNGVVNASDVFVLINFLFAAGPTPAGEADVNGDRAVDVQDVFYLINFLFAAGPSPFP